MDNIIEHTIYIDPKDIHRKTTRGSGKGGQHRNKVETCVILTHIPTGIKVRSEEHRTQAKNEKAAMHRMQEILDKRARKTMFGRERIKRQAQVGSGMRGDKRRTYQFQNNRVIDHISGKKTTIKNIQRGKFHLLH